MYKVFIFLTKVLVSFFIFAALAPSSANFENLLVFSFLLFFSSVFFLLFAVVEI